MLQASSCKLIKGGSKARQLLLITSLLTLSAIIAYGYSSPLGNFNNVLLYSHVYAFSSSQMSFFIPLPGRDPSGISFEQLAATYCEKGGMQDDVVKVTWVLTTPAADCLERIDVIWKETHDAERTNRVSVPKTATEYNIQSVEAK